MIFSSYFCNTPTLYAVKEDVDLMNIPVLTISLRRSLAVPPVLAILTALVVLTLLAGPVTAAPTPNDTGAGDQALLARAAEKINAL
jgi:hypothetical protein